MEATGINLDYMLIVFGLPLLLLIGTVFYLRRRKQSGNTDQ
ncbi:MAG: LPXTG cell wall anchor domain-containing protein [Anaerolineaceae bacterium]|nr:LPXTG cell wall anchor domain-containing protein [Anaerolineaceae bacterium]